MINVNIELCHNDAIVPYKREEDGCYDIFPAFDEDYIEIKPSESKLIGTGIKTAFSSEYVLTIGERGSVGSKGIACRCGVVDSGYRGEIFVCLQNNSDKTVVIAKYPNDFNNKKLIVLDYVDAIAQFKFEKVNKVNYEIVEDIDEFGSARGKDCLGSTN